MAGPAGEDVENLEILVHVTAPSHGPDDIRYRALARAYLDFRPVEACKLEVTEIGSHETEPEAKMSQTKISTQRSYLDSPPLSFNGVSENRTSPKVVYKNMASPEVFRPPPAIIADSQPDGNVGSTRLPSPTRVFQTFLQDLRTSSQQHESEAGKRVESKTYVVDQSLHIPSQKSHMSGSFTPRQSSKRITLKPSSTAFEDIGMTNIALSDSNAIPKQKPLEPYHVDAGAVSVSQHGPNVSRDALAASESPKSNIQQKFQPQHSSISEANRSDNSPAGFVDNSKAWSLLLEIWPSSPPIGTKPLTLMTKHLQKLTAKMTYSPVEQTREIRPMERGHWLLNCSVWKEEQRHKCWANLGKLVGGDRVGWGVWCVRTMGFESIRVYCWGDLVQGIYLLLHLASEGKIKGISAVWIGGDGQAIVTMA